MQPAQAVRWSHWLLGHAAAWQRDDMRLRDLLPRVATLPLGSGKRSPAPAVDGKILAVAIDITPVLVMLLVGKVSRSSHMSLLWESRLSRVHASITVQACRGCVSLGI